MNKFLISSLLILLSALALYGSERRFTVVAPYGGKELRELGYLDDEGDFQQLKWSRQRRSPEYSAPDSGDLSLVKPMLNEKGETIYQPVLLLPWPGDSQLALFAVVMVDGESQPTVLSIDDELETFPVDSLKVINGLDKSIYTLAGTRKFRLNPLQLSQPISTLDYHRIDKVIEDEAYEEDKSEANPGMPLAVGVEEAGDYELIYAAGLSISPGSRVLCLVLPPKKQGSARYQARVLLH